MEDCRTAIAKLRSGQSLPRNRRNKRVAKTVSCLKGCANPDAEPSIRTYITETMPHRRKRMEKSVGKEKGAGGRISGLQETSSLLHGEGQKGTTKNRVCWKVKPEVIVMWWPGLITRLGAGATNRERVRKKELVAR